jgi:uncharacterized membrane protein
VAESLEAYERAQKAAADKKRAELEADRKALAEKLMVHGALAQRTCMGHLLSGSIAGRLYPVMIMVVLTASAIAELFIFAWLTLVALRHRRCVGNDAATILAASQFARGGYEPEKLQVHSSEQVAYPPTRVQPIYRE